MSEERKPVTRRKQRPKATNAEVEYYVSVMVQMQLDGYSRHEIIEYAGIKWSITEDTFNNIYASKMRERIAVAAHEVATQKFEMLLSMALRLYHKSDKKGNLRVQLGTLQEINRMLGNHAPTRSEAKVTVTDDRPDLSAWTVEELEALRLNANATGDNEPSD